MTTQQVTTSPLNDSIGTIQSQYKKKVEEKKDPLGRDAFLTMLIEQLKHQDPLNPMQGADFSTQLAQFSSLEQLFGVNKNLTALQSSMGGNGDKDLLDYIGKEVKSNTSSIELKNGVASGAYYTLDTPADVTVTIYDDSGNQIKRIFPGRVEAGSHEITWNGTSSSDAKVQDGTYTFDISATSENGAPLPVQPSINGKVTGVIYEDGTPYLLMGDKRINPSNVIEVKLASEEQNNNDNN
ncbi:MAG: flagellar hook assembly protein FlgD [Desulfobacterales bacterium]|nr:flagellar hook assembly protein FlgD [Desulfobacterales bacterium]